MKKSIFILGLAAVVMTSCGETKKEKAPKAPEKIVQVGDVALGEKLFVEKTCTACHQADMKVIGPSVKEITKIYTENNGDLVAFLKGNAAAIVDTDPGQVAVMKANLDGVLTGLSDKEYAAIAAYIKSVK